MVFIPLITKGQTEILFSEIRPPYKSISPIVNDLLSNKVDSDDFWKKATKTGLPIIEVDSLYSDYVWVTLFYKDTTENKKISFWIRFFSFTVKFYYYVINIRFHKNLMNTR